ncbi:dTDP-4-amino-4,6-dideoxygalactose transaminase [Shinella sp.]|uniref:dTDP-4-amino-4,6-dideoxygalactose transaminase n=1 Tax=Shinella sp. TaxID=1870904 RepID=UPI0039E48B64
MAKMQHPFNHPSPIGKELEYIQDAIARGQLSGDGYYTRLSSRMLSEATGAQAALLTHSCTAALEMAAILLDLREGDEVIMPSFTFVSTANAVALRGATPVFVDIDPRTLNIDPEAVARAITPRTKSITAVHYAGVPADMDALRALADAHGLSLVEDAAQALGSTYKGRKAGQLADMAAFSFHETKNIISGEGGALTICRPDLIERAEIIREKGTNRSRFLRGQVDKYTWVDIGSSFLPSELIAAFLAAQLEQVEKLNRQRLMFCQRYAEAFADLEESGRGRLPYCPPDCESNGHMFYLLLRDIEDRDAFISFMRERGVATPFHYVPLHSAPAGLRYGRASGALAVTDNISGRLVRLPMYFCMNNHIEPTIAAARKYLLADSA